MECPSLSSGASEFKASGERGEPEHDKKIKSRTFFVIRDWARNEAERSISNSGRIEDRSNGELLTAGEDIGKNVLKTADHYTNHRMVGKEKSGLHVR